jgi:hypothetical protein
VAKNDLPVAAARASVSFCPVAVLQLVQSGTDAVKWRFPSGVPGKRLLLAGVEANDPMLDPQTPQELENRRNALAQVRHEWAQEPANSFRMSSGN